MKLCIQRVKEASVSIENKIIGNIEKGLLVFIGISRNDTEKITDELAEKLINLRIFEDENRKMNLSLKDVEGELLVVSQFTLYSNCERGNRPSFTESAAYDRANDIYTYFVNKLKQIIDFKVETGKFGADMQVSLINDGPVTIILEKN